MRVNGVAVHGDGGDGGRRGMRDTVASKDSDFEPSVDELVEVD